MREMNLRKFPFDIQDFSISIEMNATDAKDVRFIRYADPMFHTHLLTD